jgi:5-methylcytosine-specific restriction enzyme subunit McrC
VPSYYLYEYSTGLDLTHEAGLSVAQIQALEDHLQTMWTNRPAAAAQRAAGRPATEQRFLQFHRDGTVSALNYVGVVQCGSTTLHLLPKVFEPVAQSQPTMQPSPAYLRLIQAHLYWWLSYSPRVHFPRDFTAAEAWPTDLLEVLVSLFAQYTHELLGRNFYQYYQEITEDSTALRGRLDFTAYARNYATGRSHLLPCTYDSFQVDNPFNRLLKQVVYRLLHFTKQVATRQLLEELHSLLSEVADQPAVASDCDQVHFSPLFADYLVVLDYCRLFLQGMSSVVTTPTELEVFAVLLPSQALFEEFVVGFLRTHFSHYYEIQAQTQDLYLAQAIPPVPYKPYRRFQLRHDLLLEPIGGGQPLILDAKYKVLVMSAIGIDPYAVDQEDLYQMVSYAIRRGTRNVYLLYPDTYVEPASNPSQNQLAYHVDDSLGGSSICITAYRLPVICTGVLEQSYEVSFTVHQQLLISYMADILSHK